jgi:hypothetical protein
VTDPTSVENSIAVRSSGLLQNKSVVVTREQIEIRNDSGEIELSCPFAGVKLVSCGFVGSVSPLAKGRLNVELRDGNGSILSSQIFARHYGEPGSSFHVNNFQRYDVTKLAEAIARLRPDFMVIEPFGGVSPGGAKSLLSPPVGTWQCTHCKADNPIPEPVWKMQQAAAIPAKIIGFVPPTEVVCPSCKRVVKVSSVMPKGCFVATAALGSASTNELIILQQFRDQCLNATAVGRLLVACYYIISPPLAAIIVRHPRLRVFVRDWLVIPAAAAVSKLRLQNGTNATDH